MLEAHEDEVWFLQFSHNGRYLASSSKDCTAIIWEVRLQLGNIGTLTLNLCSKVILGLKAFYLKSLVVIFLAVLPQKRTINSYFKLDLITNCNSGKPDLDLQLSWANLRCYVCSSGMLAKAQLSLFFEKRV